MYYNKYFFTNATNQKSRGLASEDALRFCNLDYFRDTRDIYVRDVKTL